MSHEAELLALQQKYANKPTGNIVFYGSSSIRLWPGLERAFPTLPIENWGFGGSTLREGAHYYARFIAPRAPQSLVVYAGDNDLSLCASPREVWQSLRDLLDQSGDVPLAFISLKLSPSREYLRHCIEETNERCYQEIAARPNAIWVEVFEPMLNHEGRPRAELFVADALHLSRAGYDLWNSILQRDVAWLRPFALQS